MTKFIKLSVITFTLAIAVWIIWHFLNSAASYQPYNNSLPSGSILFTTGSPDQFYVIDLPTKKTYKLDIKLKPKIHNPVVQMTELHRGIFFFEMYDGSLYQVKLDSGKYPTIISIKNEDLWKEMTLSPDGKLLAFLKPKGSNEYQLCIREIATAKTRIIVENVFWDSIRWSPKGDSIVFVKNMDSKKDSCLQTA